MDSALKEQAEDVLQQLGLNMTVVVNMLFKQIVREQSVPLSLTLHQRVRTLEELNSASAERASGYLGRTADAVAEDMERIVAEAERKYES